MNDPVTYLRLISELEGSSQLLKLHNEQEDKELIDLRKRKYYKLYFITKKDAKETWSRDISNDDGYATE